MRQVPVHRLTLPIPRLHSTRIGSLVLTSCDLPKLSTTTWHSRCDECLWMCGRGPARLCCQLRRHSRDDFELEVVRTGRLYAAYRFVERHTFEGNGWMAA